LKIAGMVTVGRVNMSEFAFSGLGLNPHYGTPLNPRSTDIARIPGGSSSGSGVSVAAGLVPVSIGTDTGGSVRIPAALNGIVGYKATRGRYPMKGVFPLANSLDSLGPLCRTVKDAIWVDAAMQGLTAPSIGAGLIANAEIIIPEDVVFEDAQPEVAAVFEGAVSRLADAGAKIVRLPFPSFSAILALMASHGALVTAEAYWLHRGRISGEAASQIDPRVVSRTRFGEKIMLTDYLDILDARARLIAEVDALIGGRLVAFPTVAHVAPALEPLKMDDDLFVTTNARTLRNTLLGNFLDWCGVSIPCGTGQAGMPVGFLLSAPQRADERLLSFALTAEAIIRGDT
jgi:aspartyl-tRNA(Asn)/glutamyl-tRNA(Gln) amidotransferase subunit A